MRINSNYTVCEQYYYQRKDAQRQQDGPGKVLPPLYIINVKVTPLIFTCSMLINSLHAVREQYYYQLKKALEQQDEQQKEPDMQPEAKLEQDEPCKYTSTNTTRVHAGETNTMHHWLSVKKKSI